MPEGARVISLVGMTCSEYWPMLRNGHLGAMVIVRRDGFANDQWVIEGVNLLDLKYTKAGYFAADPSQLVRPNRCLDPLHRMVDRSLSTLPRDDFDYVWLIDPPAYDPQTVADMKLVWRGPAKLPLQNAAMTTLSIVVPCFNEEACLHELHQRLGAGRDAGRRATTTSWCSSTTARAMEAGRSCSALLRGIRMSSRSTCRATMVISSRLRRVSTFAGATPS